MAGVDLIKRKVLSVCRLATYSLVDAAMQFRCGPSKISFTAPGIESPSAGIDAEASQNAANLYLNAVIQ